MINDNPVHELFGMPHSLYTGIARSYLRTQGIAYRELGTRHPSFASEILPVTRRSIIPVLRTIDGEIIQDSLDIIDHFEVLGVPYSAYPQGPLQRILAIVLQYYGCQSMLRHAMHYRWSFLDQQEAFIRHAFASALGAELAEDVMQRMQSYLPGLGVTPETAPLIEASYHDLLQLLNAHLAQHPYLLGGRPSIADYGLIGPLYAHLGRDPVPAGIMKTTAPWVYRWVERMLAPGLDVVEFADYGTDFIADDAIPDTLAPLLAHVAADIFPELTDKLAFMDAWVAEKQPADGQPVGAKPHQRHIGQVQTQFRGLPIQAGVEPYLLYLLQRAGDVLHRLPPVEQERVHAALEGYGLLAAVPAPRDYRVGRAGQLEVWQTVS
ncbi:glutathione S-transferase family protein [Halopseudomonas salegens]|uniref:Glutathione S-transferase n=1 Tax=Halopseudomonas salegens TaxID=1434072 RepID=A0A1H2E9Q0_9GAMM|nr:glutathione S-transferase family protein [Halopseudomonas salegens]SDT91418.1 Glutathione S-transferase [Halopseudomonas salegens]